MSAIIFFKSLDAETGKTPEWTLILSENGPGTNGIVFIINEFLSRDKFSYHPTLALYTHFMKFYVKLEITYMVPEPDRALPIT